MLWIDSESRVSIYDQLRNQVRELIATGVLREGEMLPSLRQLAEDLGVHFNTVARAYRQLRDEGVLVIGPGRGVFVRASRPASQARQARELLGRRLRTIFIEARLIGLSTEQTRKVVLGELDRFDREEAHPDPRA
jgi:DNA-binding transcriptional regulator YhcF (GntR family)